MDFVHLARRDLEQGIEKQQSQKANAYVKKWTKFCQETGIKNRFLQDKTNVQKTEILCAFAAAIRRNHFGRTSRKILLGNSVRDTIRHVRQDFRTHGFSDPGADETGATALQLTRIFNGYKKRDPNIENQNALPLIVFKLLYFNKLTTKNRHLGLITVGALFFGMRSCEYLQVQRASEKQTKLLEIRNLQFFRNNKKLDIHSDNLSKADFIAITFESQKNGEKLQSVVQHRSNRTLCPVKAWGTLVHLILSYQNTDESTTLNYFISDNKPNYITASDMIIHLRSTCMSLGENSLGICPKKIGTHSIRTSFAMQLHLAGVPDFTIMLMGRWKSPAFLRYIRPQVQQFSKNLATLMSSGPTSHFSVNHTRRNLVQSRVFQRQRN